MANTSVEDGITVLIEELKRLQWHSRRGMLELDSLLVPFADQVLETLPTCDIEAYRCLLSYEDPELYLLLSRKQTAPSVTMAALILAIHRHHALITAT